ncbi:uncharacterized protein KIAA0825-like [Xyrauchen texanus]|uniref:uncharacterized protein KIAA0825-like n=1 Tax=Xyrauchen texanus TaxID=154827 RepID=UPI002242AA1E|nr:uncharacterized protein KIAA0825-like [Xyrauchen texanus]
MRFVAEPLYQLSHSRPNYANCFVRVFERMERDPAQESGGPTELTEHKIRQLLLELCHRAGGSQHLRQIHHSIQLNEALLKSILTTLPEMDAESSLGCVIFFSEANGPNCHISQFNPFTECNSIGCNKFDQAAMGESEWDWAQLLPAYQSMSQVTFTMLLANRWEMQDAAALEDEEDIFVDHLKKIYLNKKLNISESPKDCLKFMLCHCIACCGSGSLQKNNNPNIRLTYKKLAYYK